MDKPILISLKEEFQKQRHETDVGAGGVCGLNTMYVIICYQSTQTLSDNMSF